MAGDDFEHSEQPDNRIEAIVSGTVVSEAVTQAADDCRRVDILTLFRPLQNAGTDALSILLAPLASPIFPNSKQAVYVSRVGLADHHRPGGGKLCERSIEWPDADIVERRRYDLLPSRYRTLANLIAAQCPEREQPAGL